MEFEIIYFSMINIYIYVGGDFIELGNSDNRRAGGEWRSCEQDTSSPIILQSGSVDPVEWL